MKYLFLVLLSVVTFGASPKGIIMTKEYKLDFSTATSAAGTYSLGTLDTGAIIKNAVLKVTTALAGSSTVSATIGRAGDTDGYLLSKEVLAGKTAGTTWFGDGSSIWDDTNDVNIPYYVAAGQGGVNFYITAGVVPTSGVLSIMVDYYVPRY